ncbi:hypothetical protein PHPALM_21038 [Phytophthora palmivora]|uniref:Uncharacterized protein n=1 Tax=Phytophthora palmivora TaxID=4796 RepID=A0A2P4XDB7_9STRA|nr:hypothetical protein PHPALM_21038 [Phytophthora palmivora]
MAAQQRSWRRIQLVQTMKQTPNRSHNLHVLNPTKKLANSVMIKVSGNITRVERQKLNRADLKQKVQETLIEYNKGMKLRTLFRENDICDVVTSIMGIKPGVNEAVSFITAFQVKAMTTSIVSQWKEDVEFVPNRVQYRLPESVVDNAPEKLRSGLAKDELDELDSDGECTVASIYSRPAGSHEMAVEFTKCLSERGDLLCMVRREIKQHIGHPVRPHIVLLETRPSKSLLGFGFDLCYSD